MSRRVLTTLLTFAIWASFIALSDAACASGVRNCANGQLCPLANQKSNCRCSACNCTTCLKGYACETVDTTIAGCDKCTPSPCPHENYTCTPEFNTFSCACAAGFTGKDCEFVTGDPCSSYPCLNGGACEKNGYGYTCTCSGTNYGSQCQYGGDPCAGLECIHGNCSKIFNDAKAICGCEDNWQGAACNETIAIRNQAGSVKCYNYVIALNNTANFEAYDDPAMTVEKCRDKMLENSLYEVFILAGMTCFMGKEFPPFGRELWYDGECNTQCAGNNAERCGTAAKVWPYAYPYTYEPTQCRDARQCTNSAVGHCVEKTGGFDCVCAPGREGPTCWDYVDPCTDLVCENYGTCTKTADQSAAYCRCPDGYFGEKCEVKDSCFFRPCKNGGVCTNAPSNNFTCACPSTFTGPTCEVYVACASNPCGANGGCTDVPWGLDSYYTCSCGSGWTGSDCKTDIDECSLVPPACFNFGTCTNLPGSFKCDCIDGTSGKDCSINPDDCIGEEIHNNITYANRCNIYDANATCIDGFNNYTCFCGSSWDQFYCDEDVNECLIVPPVCFNQATCHNTIGSFRCTCLAGTYGDDCSINPDDCTINPVTVGSKIYDNECVVKDPKANCTDGYATFTCQCGDAWQGPYCQDDVDECVTLSPYPCQNFGTCHNTPGSFYCSCIEGTEGDYCEINPDDCANITICNSTDRMGKCVDGYAQWSCVCGPDYTAKYCDLEMIIYNVLQLIGGTNGTNEEDLIQMMRDLLNNPSMMKDLVPFIIGLQSEAERTSRSWEAEDFFLWATYEEKTIDLQSDFIKWNDVVLGNCFTFNHLNNSMQYLARSAGAEGGLRVAVKLNSEEYVPWVETEAVMAFIHPQSETIFSESPRYNAEPGGETAIQVTESRYRRLGGKFGRCVKEIDEVDSYYYIGSYTTDGCLRSCYQDQVQKACECMDSRYPMSKKAKACDLPQRECVDSITAKGDVSKWAGCDCPLPCENSQFAGSWTRSPFVLNTNKCNTLTKAQRDNSTTCAAGQVRPNYAILSLKLPSLRVNIFEESPTWNFNRFISNIGGLGGVVCGISLIIVFEFVFLFAVLIYQCFKYS